MVQCRVRYSAVFRLKINPVFFFKQKTSYEVRISDWSSDVCSSDLAPTTAPAPHEPDHDRERSDPAISAAQAAAGDRRARRAGHKPREIGRASCRERVCQYV